MHHLAGQFFPNTSAHTFYLCFHRFDVAQHTKTLPFWVIQNRYRCGYRLQPCCKIKNCENFPWDLWNLCLWKFSTMWYSWGTYFLYVSIIPILWLMSLNVIVRSTHTYVNTSEWLWEVWMEMEMPPHYHARVWKQTEKGGCFRK